MQSILEREAFTRRLRESLSRNDMHDSSPAVLAREFNRRFPGQPVSVQAVRKWLHGESIPNQVRLTVLAQWLGVSTEWLRFGGSEAMVYRVEEPGLAVDYELARDFARLSPRHQAAVRQLVKNLIDESS